MLARTGISLVLTSWLLKVSEHASDAPVTIRSNGRELAATRHPFDAVEAGDWIRTGTVTVTAGAIDAFAELSGDRFAIHMDDAAAKAKGFPGRVAHGLLVLSLIDGLKNQASAQLDAIASLGWDWSFRKPVLVGDQLSALITVRDKRETSRRERGILTLEIGVENQRGEVVQRGINQLMLHR